MKHDIQGNDNAIRYWKGPTRQTGPTSTRNERDVLPMAGTDKVNDLLLAVDQYDSRRLCRHVRLAHQGAL